MKKQTQRNTAKKHGFTLIELLVVMVIIGILAGIGIAGFQSYQKKALSAKIKSECGQVDRCKKLTNACLEGGGSAESCKEVCQTDNLCENAYQSFPIAGTNFLDIGGAITDPNLLHVSMKILFPESFEFRGYKRLFSRSGSGRSGQIRTLANQMIINTGYAGTRNTIIYTQLKHNTIYDFEILATATETTVWLDGNEIFNSTASHEIITLPTNANYYIGAEVESNIFSFVVNGTEYITEKDGYWQN